MFYVQKWHNMSVESYVFLYYYSGRVVIRHVAEK